MRKLVRSREELLNSLVVCTVPRPAGHWVSCVLSNFLSLRTWNGGAEWVTRDCLVCAWLLFSIVVQEATRLGNITIRGP